MKKILWVLASLIGVLLLASVIVNLLLDREQLTTRVQDEMGDLLGLDVVFEQSLHISLWRGPQVRAGQLTLSAEGEEVARVERALVRLRLLPLLRGEIALQALLLDAPQVHIERIDDGVFRPALGGRGEGSLAPLMIPRVRVRDAVVQFHDRPGDRQWLLRGCRLQLDDLQHAGGEQSDWLGSLAMQGRLACDDIEQGRLRASAVTVEFAGEDGQLLAEPLTGQAFAGQLAGRLRLDLAAQPAQYSLQLGLDDFSLDDFLAALDEDQQGSGRLTLALELEGEGADWLQLRQSAAGTLSLAGSDLVLYGVDLDEELDSYAATQRFNLVDVGAVFLVGPMGLAASRGYSFTGMLRGSGDQTPVSAMSSEWSITQGRARADDVAMRTQQSRLALAGELDFIDYDFAGMRVAVIDVDGCAIIEQRIDGPFRAPQVARPNVLVEAMGPVLDLLERGLNALDQGSDCDTFYHGSIAHPEHD